MKKLPLKRLVCIPLSAAVMAGAGITALADETDVEVEEPVEIEETEEAGESDEDQIVEELISEAAEEEIITEEEDEEIIFIEEEQTEVPEEIDIVEEETEIVLALEGWQKDDEGYWHYYIDGVEQVAEFVTIKEKTYYFGVDGRMYTGRLNKGGHYYFFNENGVMQKGWVRYAEEWCYFGEDGASYEGWGEIGGKKYYFDHNCYMVTGLKKIGEDYYYFDETGVLQKGWIELKEDDGSKWIHADSDGKVSIGWEKINKKWYYFARPEDGCFMYTGACWISDGVQSANYYFNEDGVMQTGWIRMSERGNFWFYAGSDGKLVTGFREINGKTYYFSGFIGMMQGITWTSESLLDADLYGLYYFGSDGVMKTNVWGQSYNHYGDQHLFWAYFGADGKAVQGWKKIGGKWYYFDPDSREMVTGLNYIDGASYFFDENGVMQTGWIQDGDNWYYADPDNEGKLAQYELMTIKGKTYCFDNECSMVTGLYKDLYGFYYLFGDDGVLLKRTWKDSTNSDGAYELTTDAQISGASWGILQRGNKIYNCYIENGSFVYGFRTIGGKTYYFTPFMEVGGGFIEDDYYVFGVDGVMKKGWALYDGEWFYLGSDGKAVRGWKKIGDKWYYFDKDPDHTPHLVSGTIYYNGWYYTDENGVMQTGGWTETSDGHWMYLGSDGKAVTGWKKIGGKWYYFQNSNCAYMVTGVTDIDGEIWCFGEDGSLKSGWYKNYESWYYFGTDGKAVKGFKTIGGKTYYFDSFGTMVAGFYRAEMKEIDGDCYVFDTNGVMLTGWQTVDDYGTDRTYYLGSDGKAVNGWQKISGKWYYFIVAPDSSTVNCNMVTGLYYIGGKHYYFNDNGVMQTGWIKTADGYYYANNKGEIQTGWQTIDGKVYHFDSNDYLMDAGYVLLKQVLYNFGSNGVCKNPPEN